MTDIAAPIKALHQSLATAADRSEAVAKSSRNEHHKYNYASAEDVLVAANEAMSGLGLAIVPQRSSIEHVGELYILQREFLITHIEGATYLASMSWPLDINKGKTPDKAAAGAETTSFAYFLRTLFRMPRLAEDDINHRSHERSARQLEEQPSGPMTSKAPVQAARKAVLVLRAMKELTSVAGWEKARDKWYAKLAERGAPLEGGGVDDGGFTDDEVREINEELAKAKVRVGA